MPRIPKRLIALGGLAAAGAAALKRRRSARSSASSPSPIPPAATTPVVSPVAPPPVETPGPSVTPPGRGTGSETERAERAEALTPDSELLQGRRGGTDDELVEAETAAAAAEAGAIGGPRIDDADADPALAPVYEAGGGEAEGFEAAEAELIENATHGDGGAEPIGDAFTPEREADAVTAVDGEADEEKVSEVVEDVTAEESDEGAGPGITHER